MKNKLSFSLLIVYFIGLTNALNIAADGVLFDMFAMQTKKFFTDIELWRVFTFSFFSDSIEGFALFLFAFVFISNKIEQFLGNKIYPLFIILITFLTGTITTVFLVKENVSFGGLEGTSFFLITSYILFSKNNFIRNNNLSLRISMAISFLLWFGIKIYIATEYGFISIVPSFLMSFCGILIGTLMYLQICYIVRKRSKVNKNKTRKNKIRHNADFIGYSIYTNPNFKKQFFEKFEENYRIIKEKIEMKTNENVIANSLTDEEKLDQILDKINLVGQSNLTKQELEFLNDYSNKLQYKK